MIARITAYGFLWLLATAVPVVLVAVNPNLIGYTSSRDNQIFELLGLSGTIAFALAAWFEFHRSRSASLQTLLPLALGFLVGFHTLYLISEYSEKLWDFHCYQEAATALLSSTNPYTNKTWWYQYPPLTAQVFAALFSAIKDAASWFKPDWKDSDIWSLIFYLYQSCQILLVMVAYWLSILFAKRAGITLWIASALIAILFLVDSPLIRTLRWSQVNLWILDLTLLAILLRGRFPILAGLAIALGAHIKIYPIILLAPWLLTRQWRAVGAAAAGIAGILLLQTQGGQDWQTWKQFVEFMPQFPPGTFFRDNSIHGVVYNLFHIPTWGFGLLIPPIAVEFTTVALTVASVGWFVMRFFARENTLSGESLHGCLTVDRQTFRHDAHAVDAVALSLIAAPSVWEHHYLLVIPIIIFAVAHWGRTRAVSLSIAYLLIFALPVFDVFVLSYHRLAGLLLLIWIVGTRPTGPPIIPQVATSRSQEL